MEAVNTAKANVKYARQPQGTPAERRDAFWARVWTATNEIEELNNNADADFYDNLTEIGRLLDDIETAGTFVTGAHTTEVVFLVTAIAEAVRRISLATPG